MRALEETTRKSEARNPKSETISNDQNPNDQNQELLEFRSGEFLNPSIVLNIGAFGF